MSKKKNNDIEQEPLQRKLEELIKKKSEENTALKKLLEGLSIGNDEKVKNDN